MMPEVNRLQISRKKQKKPTIYHKALIFSGKNVA
jgi:hypothetical protein